jgi:hypothetical protein
MLQWKPKLFVLVAVLALVAALMGRYAWAADQFTWI